MKPTPGRIVMYSVLPAEVSMINKRRSDFASYRRSHEYRDTGYMAHFGNAPTVGEALPMIITHVNADGSINGQVYLDGNDNLWVKRVAEGKGPGTWAWPTRE